MIDKKQYLHLYNTMIITADKVIVDSIAFKIQKFKDIYKKIKIAPYYVVGCIHYLEANFNFNCHLHNGDPLTAKTIHYPKNRPYGTPPFTWEYSAKDALTFSRKIPDVWTLSNTLEYLERYNGLGYRKYNINSPYLWAGSNHYTKGKFVADGKFDPNAVSKQIGAAVIINWMEQYYNLKLIKE